MMNELMVHELFPFALCGQMRWSKNILEECHCSNQIILGANDPDFCVLLNAGIYLENTFPTEVNDEGLINCFACAGNALNTKKAVSRILKDLFHSEDFKNRFCNGAEFGSLLDQWLCTSHSFRKFALQHTLVVMVEVGMRLICEVMMEAPEASSVYVCRY